MFLIMGVEIDIIIANLSDTEKHILLKMAKLGASPNKNVKLETIQKRLLKKYRINVDNTINKLIAQGIVLPYRHKNYPVSPTAA